LLELYHEPRSEKAYRERFVRYHGYLKDMQKDSIITAAMWINAFANAGNLCGFAAHKNPKIKQPAAFFPDVIDRQLFEQILKAGERSAILENRAATNDTQIDPEKMPSYFFYLNVSQNEKAWIVRVEIPQWVAGMRKRSLCCSKFCWSSVLLWATNHTPTINTVRMRTALCASQKKKN
jgi:hypothetical protein